MSNDAAINLRLPSDVLERAAALVPRLAADPLLRAAGLTPTRSTVLRLAVVRGLDLIEGEFNDKTGERL